MAIEENVSLKDRIRRGERLVGLFACIPAFQVTEILSHTRLDYLMLEAEHSATTPAIMHAQIAAMAGRMPVAVRCISDEVSVLKPILDLGVDGIMVPNVHTAQQARAIVELTRFAPDGTRGIGGSVRAADFGAAAGFYSSAEPRPIAVIVQVESLEGLANTEAIAQVDGVDAVFFGPQDLSARMGFRGQPNASEVRGAIERGMRQVISCGTAAGCLCAPDQVAFWRRAGGTVFLCGSDIGLLTGGARGVFDRLEEPVA